MKCLFIHSNSGIIKVVNVIHYINTLVSYYVADKVTDTVSLLHLIMSCQLMRHSNSDIQINGKLESSVLASLVPGVRRECSRIFNCNNVLPGETSCGNF